MSAFLCSNTHINTLASAAENCIYIRSTLESWRAGTGKKPVCEDVIRWRQSLSDLAAIGHILHNENVRSVNGRYHEFNEYPYKSRRLYPCDAVILIKAIQCYNYQACESDDWESTTAHEITKNLMSHAISKLPGYDKAPWGIEEAAPQSQPKLVSLLEVARGRESF